MNHVVLCGRGTSSPECEAEHKVVKCKSYILPLFRIAAIDSALYRYTIHWNNSFLVGSFGVEIYHTLGNVSWYKELARFPFCFSFLFSLSLPHSLFFVAHRHTDKHTIRRNNGSTFMTLRHFTFCKLICFLLT